MLRGTEKEELRMDGSTFLTAWWVTTLPTKVKNIKGADRSRGGRLWGSPGLSN